MPEKICFVCKDMKELSEFYKHKEIPDGHLNKCKSCTKNQSKVRYHEKVQDTEWHELEKARGRTKYRRLEYRVKYKASPESKAEVMARYYRKFPEKQLAHNLSQHLKPRSKGNHLHHWCYHESCVKDVIELTPEKHYLIHRLMAYDKETMCYKVKETGEVLDTKLKHLLFIFNNPF